MNISFDTSAFVNDPRGLIGVLQNLHLNGAWSLGHHREIEAVVCRTPSSALRYCRDVQGPYGVSRESERVFLKNPGIAIRYLKIVGRRHFLDEDTQRRFWRKVVKDPDAAYEWANAFRTRLSEEEEEVFVENVAKAKDYAFFIIKDAFPERIHRMLVLRSFENLDPWEKCCLTEYIRWAEPRLRNSSEKEVKV